MKAAGLCVGASNISFAVVERLKGETPVRVLKTGSIPHEGNPRRIIENLQEEGFFREVHDMAVTGKKYRRIMRAAQVSEPEAVEEAYAYIRELGWSADAVVSGGGETTMVYTLDPAGRIKGVMTGNKCASGTGEFFLQQLKRLGLGLTEALEAAGSSSPYDVSGRCSVFCKSDCTHALNKGAAKGDIVAGLCRMMALKILELLQGMKLTRPLLIGGVSRNTVLQRYLRDKIPGIQVPPYALSFEALGAALWAVRCQKGKPSSRELLESREGGSFSTYPPLGDYLEKVIFAAMDKASPRVGDSCILGLDVGSTTTKAVLIRRQDKALLASCYLRTLGDPVAAARDCYRSLSGDIQFPVKILGLGVTGSGRQIAALHALTPAVINEIIAHAAAAVHFDPQVDTIFELGGQDAKYTYINSGVPADYAMNEACSAGTGSFLEEAAGESLAIGVEEIGGLALESQTPLNFSDQCAAFINSDIKTAIQEGAGLEDIAAGLVYSICLNYSNRVKGNRRVGRKVFMQGGVCYNRAVPAAMAALTGQEILVPPHPGLMGAFGAALEVHKQLETGLLKPSSFDLQELAERQVSYLETFRCRGGREDCDRGCTINRLQLKGKTYPFGGACNKYVNLLRDEGEVQSAPDLVKVREELAFKTFGRGYCPPLAPSRGQKVGILPSLMTATLFPLYANYFEALGFHVILAGEVSREGLDRKGAAYCHPVEMAHGLMGGLLADEPDYIFLPHVKSMPVPGGEDPAVTCPFVQGEPYYLTAAFPGLSKEKILAPVLEMASGYGQAREALLELGRRLGVEEALAGRAFDGALAAQEGFHRECRRRGEAFLKDLGQGEGGQALVLFGRPYNAFSKGINMAVPGKFASRGCSVIPHDFLPLEEEENFPGMYWSSGQIILKAARFVKKHPRLYAAYITNFSCGPDSFLTGYFRDIMGDKPSLILELDSHTADAGLDTRIEALLDVIENTGQGRKTASGLPEVLSRRKDPGLEQGARTPFRAARIISSGKKTRVEDSRGRIYSLEDSGVQVLIPAMGLWGADLLAASFRRVGVSARALPAPGEREFKLGQSLSTCKECLPYLLTLGSLMASLEEKNDGNVLVYFMPETSGPCRFGQYNVQMKQLVQREALENTAFLSLTSANGYAGFGSRLALRAWQAVIINDALEELYSTLITLAEDRHEALKVYRDVALRIVRSVEYDTWPGLERILREGARMIKVLKMKQPPARAPRVSLVGEIYVRQDHFSLKNLVERLAGRGIMVRTAPVAEWLYYCDYLVKERLVHAPGGHHPWSGALRSLFKKYFERRIKAIYAETGLLECHPVDIEATLERARPYMDPRLTGEAILTLGSALLEGEKVSGVLAIGPFGCMPGRMAEALITRALEAETRPASGGLPFLAVETDGNPFTPVVESRLDAFCLQVHRRNRPGSLSSRNPS